MRTMVDRKVKSEAQIITLDDTKPIGLDEYERFKCSNAKIVIYYSSLNCNFIFLFSVLHFYL